MTTFLSDQGRPFGGPAAGQVFGDCADALVTGRPARGDAGSGGSVAAQDAVAWRRATWALGLASVALVAVFWQTAWSAVLTWYNSDTFGHCFLILPAAGYLAWRRKAILLLAPPGATLWGVAAMALAAAGWLVGALTGTLVIQQFGLVLMIQGLVWALLGHRATWILAFPLFYLFFAVPFGDFLIPPMQDFTAKFVVQALRMIAMPVYVDGWMIHIPSGSFHVAEACAGVRFLISTIALGLLAADVLYQSLSRRLAFLALAAVLPIVANGFRAFGIVITAHLTDYKVAAGADHITYGLVFLSIVTFLLLAIGMTFRDSHGEASNVNRAAWLPASGLRGSNLSMLGLSLMAALVVVLSVRGYGLYTEQRLGQSKLPGLQLIESRAGWQAAPQAGSVWRPDFRAADLLRFQSYRKADRQVDLFVAFFTHQRQAFEVSNPTNRFADDETWVDAASGSRKAVLDDESMVLRYERIKSGSSRRLVWYWYWVDGRFTANPYLAKLLEARAKLFGGENAAAVLAVATLESEGAGAAAEDLSVFLQEFSPLRDMLQERGEQLRGTASETSSAQPGES